MRAAVIAAFLVALTTGSYFFGQHQGRNSEELKNARAQISALTTALEEHKNKQTSDAVALAELRVAESASRNELDRMRQQLSEIERAAKTAADRDRNRCLRLAVEGRELLDRARAAIEFCETNHK
ncbi:hypothetical protein [uncultured Parasutterella sp.]|uniref:hypothetical protein n=1 Tax=uncultured Parasutterella sp. TaxID=1263098 RepID=UPI0025939759|nr:hypothetical protein [uncultured Parasutterella sp.]